MTNLDQTTEPAKTEKVCVHKKDLWALDHEQVKYTVESNLDACFDIVWINLEITTTNILYFFHAGFRKGKQSSNSLNPAA
jgi:hypothetical protein